MANTDLTFAIKAVNEASAALKAVQNDLKGVEGQGDKTDNALGRLNTRMEGLVGKYRSVMAVGAGLGLSLGGLGAIASKLGTDFDTAFRQVQTLFPGAEQSVAHMKGEVVDLSKSLGVDAVGSTKALYQALSASVPPENAMTFLRDASKAAIAGSVSTATAVDVLTNVLNAYHMSASEAEHVSDVLFVTAARGKTTFSELSSAMFNVAPTAAAAGVAFDEVAAAIATVTKQGVPTTVATTQLRQAIVELQKPGQALKDTLNQMGFESGAAALKALGLQGTLQGLAVQAEANGQTLTQVFSSVEAGSAALALTGQNAQAAADDLNGMKNAAGTTEAAFKTMNEGVGRQLERMKVQLQDVALQMGTKLVPVLGGAADGMSLFVAAMSKMPIQSVITGGAIGALVMMLPKVVDLATGAGKAVGTLVTNLLDPRMASRSFSLNFNQIALGITAISIAADAIIRKTSGHGLLEWIFGDPAKADQLKKIMNDTAAVATALGSNFDAAGYATNHMNAAITALGGQLADITNAGYRTTDMWSWQDRRIKEAATSVQEYAKQIAETHPPLTTIIDMHNELAQQLADATQQANEASGAERTLAESRVRAAEAMLNAFDAGVNYNALMEAGRVSADQLTGGLQQLPADVDMVAAAQQNAAAGSQAASTSMDGYTQKLNEANSALSLLLQNLQQQDPVLASLNAKSAAYAVEIANLQARGDALTAAERERLQTLEAQKSAIDGAISAQKSYADAITPIAHNLTLIAGGHEDAAQAVNDFVGVLQSSNRDVATAEQLMSQLNTALDNTDASTAIAEVQNLKGTLSPDEWAAAAAIIGPAVVQKIQDGVASPEAKERLYNALYQLTGNAMYGAMAGIQAMEASVVATGAAAMDNLVAQMRAGLAIQSPSKVTRDKVGIPITQGVAEGILAAMPELDAASDEVGKHIEEGFKEHAKTAAEVFSESLMTTVRNANLAAEFGDEGAKILETFEDALTNPSSAARLPDMIVSLIQEMHDAGVPNAQALGDALGAAIVAGLNGQANDIGGAIKNITDALGTATALTVDSFNTAVSDAVSKANVADAVGRQGQAVLDSLSTAITDGGQKNIDALAKNVADIQSQLNSKVPEGQAAYLGTQIMTALQTAIKEQTPEAIAALQTALATANTVMQGGAINIKTGAVMTSDAVAGMAKSLGVSKDFIINNIGTMVSLGLDKLGGKLGALPQSTQDAIAKTMDAWANGKISMQTAIRNLETLLPPDIVAALKAVGDAATPVATSIGQGIGSAITQGIKDGVGTDVTKDVVIGQPGGPSTAAANAILDKGRTATEIWENILGSNPNDLTQGYLTNANGKALTISDIQGYNIGGRTAIEAALQGGALVWHSAAGMTQGTATGLVQGGVGGYFDGIYDSNGVQIGTKVMSADGKELFVLDSTNRTMGVPPVPTYAVGTPYVPRDGLAYLHRGEAVIPASENRGERGVTVRIDSLNITGVRDAADVEQVIRKVLPDEFGRYWSRELAMAGRAR